MTTKAHDLIHTDEMRAILEARGFAYSLLTRIFLEEPSLELVRSLVESDVVSLFPYAGEADLIGQGVDEVREFLRDHAVVSPTSVDEVRWDYTRMFVGPDRLPAPPWESAYRTEDRLLFQEETLAVRLAYAQHGFVNPHLGAEPDDHIGLELSFMYETCRLAAEQAATGDEAGLTGILRDQEDFLTQHLLRWAPAFAADVTETAQTGFFRGFAHLLNGYLAVDQSLVRELLAETPGA